MKLELLDPNYCATVVQVKSLVELENCDNLLGFPVFGYTAIVSKDTKIGDWGIVFTAETQLSEAFCFENNLYRDTLLNKDQSKKWYMENNRRVKAMKFRWNKSSALFMPLESLYMKEPEEVLFEWDSFNSIYGVEVCRKYVIISEELKRQNKLRGKTKVFSKIDNKTFPEHLDTENYFRNKQNYKDNDRVTITQKLHGSSGRFWYVKVRKQLSFIERLLQKLWVKIENTKYDYVYGSRRVIKNGIVVGFYKDDIRKEISERYQLNMPKDIVFYGEIIGYAGQSQIQKDYTYNQKEGECDLYVYRMTFVNEDGIQIDFDYHTMEEMCTNLGIKVVPLLREWLHENIDIDRFLNVKYFDTLYSNAVPLYDKSICDEGVVVRRDGVCPYITKAKSPDFLEKESKDLDGWIIDTETQESN